MTMYKFDIEHGSMELLNPTIMLNGDVGPKFDDNGNMSTFVAPVMLCIPGTSNIDWKFESSIMPTAWEPEDIESWAQDRLEEHKVI